MQRHVERRHDVVGSFAGNEVVLVLRIHQDFHKGLVVLDISGDGNGRHPLK